jgi:hypothetical protein
MRLIKAIVDWFADQCDPGPRATVPTPPKRLRELRSVSHTILEDVRGNVARQLTERIDAANNAIDFWHMRPRLFDAVSTEFGEVVAGRRLLQLDLMLQVNHDRRSQFARASAAPPRPHGGQERRSGRPLAAPAPVVKRRGASNESPFRTTTQSTI